MQGVAYIGVLPHTCLRDTVVGQDDDTTRDKILQLQRKRFVATPELNFKPHDIFHV